MAVLTAAVVRDLTVRIFATYQREQLRAIGEEIRATYARDARHQAENAALLEQLRKVYASRMSTMDRR